jgi:hypothetical protein
VVILKVRVFRQALLAVLVVAVQILVLVVQAIRHPHHHLKETMVV